jgi:hypothetical protein
MNKPFEDAWRSHYDEWKTASDDPGSLNRIHPMRFRCLECAWTGRGMQARHEHYLQHGGHRIIQDRR